MNWPAKINELVELGWRPATGERATKKCSCGEIFFWWITPANKWQPMSAIGEDRLLPHHATCKNVLNYRGAKKNLKAGEKPKPKQERLF